MRVLRITAWLATPVAAREQVHLDSILMAANPRARSNNITRRTPLREVRKLGIPVASIEYGGHRVFLCSAWQMPSSSRPGLEYAIKRRDMADIEHRARPWTPMSGPEKNYMMPLPMVLTPSVSWVCVGDRRKIKSILRSAKQVGAVRRQGYGMVLRWDVDVIDDPPSMSLVGSSGLAARFIPESWCQPGSIVDEGPVEPPYWHPLLRTRRVRPGSRCALTDDVSEAVVACL